MKDRILRLLADERSAMCGRDIASALGLTWRRGLVYVRLAELERDGAVEIERTEHHEWGPRHYYRLTRGGWGKLAEQDEQKGQDLGWAVG